MIETLHALTVVDYLIIAVMVTALAVGWAKGLVELLTGFLVFIVATLVAGRYTNDAITWLNRTWGAQERLVGVLQRRVTLPPEADKVPMNAIPWQKALEWLRDVPIPEAYKATLAQRLAAWSEAAGSQTASSYIIQQLAAGVLSAAVFIVLVSLVGWGLGLLARLISDQVKELPLVGTTNRMLGGAVAVLQVGVVMALIVGLLVPLMSVYGLQGLGSSIENAHLTPYFRTLFEWLRGVLFGLTRDQFFAV